MTHPLPLPRSRARNAPCLSENDIAALSKARDARWRPGLPDQPLHSEIFASARDASGAGLALALACDALSVAAKEENPLAEVQDRRQILWVQDKCAVRLTGRPYAQGFPKELRDRLVHVETARPEDTLFALEEGLKCRELACVIGEITGNPSALDFIASRRLSLTAERHGVALWLIRLDAEPDLSSARMRWRVGAAPSESLTRNSEAPGRPAWKAELFRARNHAPGQWTLTHDTSDYGEALTIRCPKQPPKQLSASASYIGHMVRPTVGRSLAAVARG